MMHRLGSLVLAICTLNDDDGYEICRPGDRGEVIYFDETSQMPLVRFKRTGVASIMDPDTEIIRSSARVRAVA